VAFVVAVVAAEVSRGMLRWMVTFNTLLSVGSSETTMFVAVPFALGSE